MFSEFSGATMIIYSFPIFAGLVGALFLPNNKVYLKFILFSLFLMIAFKGGVDKDYYSYKHLFDLAPVWSEGLNAFYEYSIYVSIEPGFLFLNLLLKTLGFGFNSVFFVFSAISCYLIYLICNSFTANRYLVFVFLYISSFIGLWVQVRFGLACLAVLFAAILYSNERVLHSSLLLLFSFSIHSVTLVFVIGYLSYRFLCIKNISVRTVTVFVLIVSLIISLLNFGDLLAGILTLINPRYEAYEGEGAGSKMSFLIRLVLFSFLFFLLARNVFNIKINKVMYAFALCSILVWSFAWGLSILYRVGALLEFGFCFFLIRDAYKFSANYFVAVFAVISLLGWRFYSAIFELDDYRLFFSLDFFGVF